MADQGRRILRPVWKALRLRRPILAPSVAALFASVSSLQVWPREARIEVPAWVVVGRMAAVIARRGRAANKKDVCLAVSFGWRREIAAPGRLHKLVLRAGALTSCAVCAVAGGRLGPDGIAASKGGGAPAAGLLSGHAASRRPSADAAAAINPCTFRP